MAREPVIMTFDLEDWFQIVSVRFGFDLRREDSDRLLPQIDRILGILAKYGARATFFVLGITAERHPIVVERCLEAGHEIASHGWDHRLVKSMTPAEFGADLDRSIATLARIAGKPPRGYRAPEFSIDPTCLWAFDVLLDKGFEYDSSVFPFKGPRYGFASASLELGRVKTPADRSIMEVPLSAMSVAARRLPIAGGGYWRLAPGVILEEAIRHVTARRAPVLYFHPAEFDQRPLSPPAHSWRMAGWVWKNNLWRATIPGKIERMLAVHRSVSVEGYIDERRRRDDAGSAVRRGGRDAAAAQSLT
jgi:polysaccharide deacetylase family protein (PEP-CTERM system associated)